MTRKIQRNGANLILWEESGSRRLAVPGPGGIWYPTGEGGGGGDPDPPDPPGDWMHPLGSPHNWTTYEDGGRSHSGGAVDFPLGYGTEATLYAPVSGPVIYAGWESGGGGNVIIIEAPDGAGVCMAHLNQIDVSVSQNVTVGDVIGLTGWTGTVIPSGPGGAHLHLEVRQFGTQWGPWFPAYTYFQSKGVNLGTQI